MSGEPLHEDSGLIEPEPTVAPVAPSFAPAVVQNSTDFCCKLTDPHVMVSSAP